MKVYEMMSKLSTMPAGARVKISMIKDLSEIPEFDDDEETREIDFEVTKIDLEDDGSTVVLDGWTI